MALGRILIVDDERPVREVLSEYFEGQGYAVFTAGNGDEALSAARRQRPDLVLLDVRMPGIDGVEVLRRLRGLDGNLAVIMVTANEDAAVARETLKLGAFDYVAKPFDFSYLDRAVAAGLLHGGGAPGQVPSKPAPAVDGSWPALAQSVFRAVRNMAAAARASTGGRMESAALAAASAGAAGRTSEAAQQLGELELLVSIAGGLGDLPGADVTAMQSAIDGVRRLLPAG